MSCNCNDNQVAGTFEPKMKIYHGSNCHKKDKFFDDCFDKKHHKHDHCKCCCCCCKPHKPHFPFYEIEDDMDDSNSDDELDSEDEDDSNYLKPRRKKKCCCSCDCECHKPCPPCNCRHCPPPCNPGCFPPPPPPCNPGCFPPPPPCCCPPQCKEHEKFPPFPEGSCCQNLIIPTEDGATLCLQQLKFILCQAIELYAGRTFEVLLEDSTTVTGTPDASLFTPPNNGMLVINTLGPNSVKVYINIANIVSVRILDTVYGNNLKYILLMCDLELAGTQASIRKLLTVGSTVVITAAGIEFEPSVVLVSALGVVVLQTGNDIQIVATNKISSVVVI